MIFLTPQELQDLSLNALGRDLTDAADVLAIQQALAASDRRVADFLHRHLFVGAYSIFPGDSHATRWAWSHQRNAYGVWAPEWPVVEVPGDDVTFTDTRIYSPEAIDELVFFAGYRKAGQTLEELQEIDGLEDLTELPPALPADILDAMIEVALLRLRPRVEGTLGSGTKIQQVGQGVVTVEAVDAGAELRVLRKIRHHQRVM